jgi:hypothetical protein
LIGVALSNSFEPETLSSKERSYAIELYTMTDRDLRLDPPSNVDPATPSTPATLSADDDARLIRPRRDYIVDELFPRYRCSLVTGPSGANKSHLIVGLAGDFAAGVPLLDTAVYVPRPARVALISLNETVDGLHSILASLGLSPASIPCFSLLGQMDDIDRTFPHMVQIVWNSPKFHGHGDLPEVLFVDGLEILCRRLTESACTADFFYEIAKTCEQKRLTVVGTWLSVKPRVNDVYASPRDRIMGSAVVSSLTSSKVDIVQEFPKDVSSPARVVTVMAPDYPVRVLRMTITDGGLVPTSTESRDQPGLDDWLKGVAAGTAVSVAQVMETAATAGIGASETAAKRWLEDQCELGTVERLTRGTYRVL